MHNYVHNILVNILEPEHNKSAIRLFTNVKTLGAKIVKKPLTPNASDKNIDYLCAIEIYITLQGKETLIDYTQHNLKNKIVIRE